MICLKYFVLKKDGTPKYNCYCATPELIENYEEAVNDPNEMWVCHHRMEEVFTEAELKRAGWYYNRKPDELIFIRRSEHNGNPKLHIGIRKAASSKERNEKISKSTKGKKKPKLSEYLTGRKRAPYSEEYKRKMSESLKGHPDWNSEKLKGRHCYNNGIIEVRAYSCPEGFVLGRLKKR